MKIKSQTIFLLLGGILALAAALKLALSLASAFPFNSDEAVVALMARHILAGERPVFFYGQAYMGSLDAFLVAAGFLIFGQQVWVIRLVQALLYTGTIGTTFLLGRDLLGSAWVGLAAAGLMAIPTVNVTLYTTISLGGYGEALLLGNIIVLAGARMAGAWGFTGMGRRPDYSRPKDTFYPALFGLAAGLGLWANGLTLVAVIPTGLFCLVYWIKNFRQRPLSHSLYNLGVVAAGFFLGSFPWWYDAWRRGFSSLIGELLGQAVAVESGPWISQALAHGANFLLLGIPVILGMRPPWEVRWLVLPLLPFILVFWGWIGYRVVKAIYRKSALTPVYLLLLGIPATVLAGFIATPFGIDPSGRYFLPFAVPLSLLAGEAIVSSWAFKRLIGAGLLALILVYQLGGTVQCAITNPPGLTTQFDATTIIDHRYDGALIQFLISQGETAGYASYWTAYPIDFLSAEKVTLVPALPYHLDFRYARRDDRYPPYDSRVDQSPKVVYITARFPALADRLRTAFKLHGINWNEKAIGDYLVFYHLSRPIRPEALNLGWLTAAP